MALSLMAVCCVMPADAQARKGSKAKTTHRVSKPAAAAKPYKGTFEYDDPSGAYAVSMVIDLYNKTVDAQNGEGKCYGVIEYATEGGVQVYDITEVQCIGHNGALVRIVGNWIDEDGLSEFAIQEVYSNTGDRTMPGVLSMFVNELYGGEELKSIELKRVKQ